MTTRTRSPTPPIRRRTAASSRSRSRLYAPRPALQAAPGAEGMSGRLVSSLIALALFAGGFVARAQESKPALPAKPAAQAASAAGASALPRLVLLVVVDQCRPDYFDRFAPRFGGFFARLRDEGRWFTEGEQHHAITVTAAGHAAIGTGRFPCHNGIVENDFFD